MQRLIIKTTIEIPIIPFNICCPLNVIGEPDMIPCNFINAITDPENVIAPIEAPNDISIKLATLILPALPKLNTSGSRKADIATKTAARPTKL